jgi:hypothetical protein
MSQLEVPSSPSAPAPPAAGLLEFGNINLFDRPRVQNPDGSISTVRSMSFNLDGQEVLVPTVNDDFSGDYAGRLREEEASVAVAWMRAQAPEGSVPPQAEAKPGADISANPPDMLPLAAWGGEILLADGSALSAIGRHGADIPLSAGHGIIQGLNQAIDLVYELGENLREAAPEWLDYNINFVDENGEITWPYFTKGQAVPPQIPQIFNAPDTATGEIVSNIAQFITGFAAGGQALKGIKAAGVGARIVKGALQGAISDFAFFDGQEERLSNLVQEFPVLQNPVNEFLTASPEDGEIEGRFKNALEGLGLGAITEGLLLALKSLRSARQAKHVSGGGEVPVGGAVGGTSSPPPETGLDYLGEADGPLMREVQPEEVLPPGGAARPVKMGTVDPATFIQARDKSTRAGFLSPYTPEELANARLYKASDMDVGYAITPEGDLINVFNNSGIEGAGAEAVIDALKNGARTLDCLGEDLVKYYQHFGFRIRETMAWDDAYAPKNWNYEKDGRPDVYFLEYPESISRNPDDVRARFKAAQDGRLQETVQDTRDDFPGGSAESSSGNPDDVGTSFRSAGDQGNSGDQAGRSIVSGSTEHLPGGSRNDGTAGGSGLDSPEPANKAEPLGVVPGDESAVKDQSRLNPSPGVSSMEEVDPATFIQSREKSTRAGFLYNYTPEQMAEMQLYKVSGADVGYALTKDGDLVNVFNNSGISDLGRDAVIDAIKNGAGTLDCFDGYLVRYYSKFGFEEIKRNPWDEAYAPKNWDYKEGGTPDVVYFKYPEGLSRNPDDVRARLESAQNQQNPRNSAGGTILSDEGGDISRVSGGQSESTGRGLDSPESLLASEQLGLQPEPNVVKPAVPGDGSAVKDQSRLNSSPGVSSMEKVDPEAFMQAKNANNPPRLHFMTDYTTEQLAEMKLFKAPGRDAGYALKPDGELSNLFNNSGVRNLGVDVLADAINKGAAKLDCIGNRLLNYYQDAGFILKETYAWDDALAPKNWPYEKEGRPNVYYLEYPEELSRNSDDVRARIRSARNQGNSGSSGEGGSGILPGSEEHFSEKPQNDRTGRGRGLDSPEPANRTESLGVVPGDESAVKNQIYINFARIDSPDDVREVLQRSADLYKTDIDEASRGTRAFQEITLSSEQENAWKILTERRQGEPLNAEQSLAARNLWASSGEKLTQLAKLAGQAPSEENLFAFRKMFEVHRAIQNEVMAARTETARSLAAWRIPLGSQELRLRRIEEAIAGSGGVEAARDLAARVSKLFEAGLSQELETLVAKTPARITMESLQEAWVMALLSGPKTHLVNMMSNTAVAFQQVFERAIAGRIGRLLVDDSGVEVGEALAMLNGMLGGVKDGLRLAAKALRMNESEGLAGKIDLPHTPAISAENWRLAQDGVLGKFVDVLGQAVRIPGRALMAEDEFFKSVGYRAQLHAYAHRQATREAAAGKISQGQVRSRMAEILENPPDAIKISAIDHAAYSTFSNAPGQFAQSWLRLTQRIPALRFVTPFVKTPANIFNYAVAERSPLAPLFRSFREDIKAGGARRQLALARVSSGTTIMLAVADLAFNGQLTGGGPANPAQRQALRQSGWQPYSVKAGDRYFSYSRFDPLGMTLGLAADLAEISSHMDQEDREADADEAAVYFAASIAGNVMSKSYMRGLSDLAEALANPQMNADEYFQRLAGSLIPAGVGENARYQDSYQLEINSMLEAMKACIPGLSQNLPARRDLWGRAISYRSGLDAFYDAVSPIASRRENPEPIDREMLRQEIYIAAPKRSLNFDGVTVDLTRDEFPGAYSRYAQLAGNEAINPAWGKGCLDYLNDVVQGNNPMSSVYQMRSDGPEGGKSEFIRATVMKCRNLAKEQLLREYPVLARYVREQKSRRLSEV